MDSQESEKGWNPEIIWREWPLLRRLALVIGEKMGTSSGMFLEFDTVKVGNFLLKAF